MKYINGFFVINQAKLDEEKESIRKFFKHAFEACGFNVGNQIRVEYEFECEGMSCFYNDLSVWGPGDSYLGYSTEGINPQPVFKGEKLELYYVFSFSACGHTNPNTMINTGHSPYDGKTVEEIVMDYIEKRK